MTSAPSLAPATLLIGSNVCVVPWDHFSLLLTRVELFVIGVTHNTYVHTLVSVPWHGDATSPWSNTVAYRCLVIDVPCEPSGFLTAACALLAPLSVCTNITWYVALNVAQEWRRQDLDAAAVCHCGCTDRRCRVVRAVPAAPPRTGGTAAAATEPVGRATAVGDVSCGGNGSPQQPVIHGQCDVCRLAVGVLQS